MFAYGQDLNLLRHLLETRERVALRLGEEWEFWSLGALDDKPLASVDNLCSALNGEQQFGLVVLNAHGNSQGVLLQNADGTAHQAWDGEGANLQHTDLLLLASCTVGRLSDTGAHDVEGLYARVAANRGKTVTAARWPINAMTTSHLVDRLAERHAALVAEAGNQSLPSFAKARALSEARRELLAEVIALGEPDCRELSIAAFDLYGNH